MRTTLILGAGASVHCGFPTGPGLLDAIIRYSSILNFFEGFYPLRERSKISRIRRVIRDQQPPSIDFFLKMNRRDAEVAAMGKHMVATTLLIKQIGALRGEPNWYGAIVQFILDCIEAGDLKRLDDLKIVTFNYDLSIEGFILRALHSLSFLCEAEREEILMRVVSNVLHVYGSLFDFLAPPDEYKKEFPDWRTRRLQIFNSAVYRKGSSFFAEARRFGNNIRIIGDPDTDDVVRKAREWIAGAEQVFILGYGFHADNNELLGLNALPTKDQFYFVTNFRNPLKVREKIIGFFPHAVHENSLAGGRMGKPGTAYISVRSVNKALETEHSFVD